MDEARIVMGERGRVRSKSSMKIGFVVSRNFRLSRWNTLYRDTFPVYIFDFYKGETRMLLSHELDKEGVIDSSMMRLVSWKTKQRSEWEEKCFDRFLIFNLQL